MWKIRLPLSLSLFPLCLCALRYFPLSQFYELLCCSLKHQRQRPEDENQRLKRENEVRYSHEGKRNETYVKNNKHEGGHKWREDGGWTWSVELSRFCYPARASRTELTICLCLVFLTWPHTRTHAHLYSCPCAHANIKCMYIKQVCAHTDTYIYNATHSYDELLIHFPRERKKKLQLIQW